MIFFDNYLDTICDRIKKVDINLLHHTARLIADTNDNGGKVILAGNGGSASIASHISVDLINSAQIRTTNFNDASLLTCLANDYGYERWLEKGIESCAVKGDLAIMISSSGRSANIINGALKARELGMRVVTFSGFNADNPLRKTGDVNFWVNSSIYNIVEITHQIWLSAIADMISVENHDILPTEELNFFPSPSLFHLLK